MVRKYAEKYADNCKKKKKKKNKKKKKDIEGNTIFYNGNMSFLHLVISF